MSAGFNAGFQARSGASNCEGPGALFVSREKQLGAIDDRQMNFCPIGLLDLAVHRRTHLATAGQLDGCRTIMPT